MDVGGIRLVSWLFLGVWASSRLVFRDVAQPGSAPEWGSGGRGFKSRRPDWVKIKLCCDFRCGAFSSSCLALDHEALA